MPRHFRLKLLIAAFGLAAAPFVCALPGNATASNALVALGQHSTTLHNGDVASGPLSFSETMHIVVSLNVRNREKLNSFLANAQQPGKPISQRSMSSQQFVDQFSPTEAQAQAVANYLTHTGFKNVVIAPNRLLVSGDATADAVGAAFSTTFESVRTHDGRTAYHNTNDVMIPSSLQGTVLSVLGLQTVNTMHTLIHPTSTPAMVGPPPPTVAHNPTDFAAIYGGSGVPTASTVPVGIIASGNLSVVLSDLALFASTNNLPAISTQVVGTGSTDETGTEEYDLDSQDIVGMSGGVQQIIFYVAPSLGDADLTADFNTVVSANAVKVINVSLGECETIAQEDGSAAADDVIFAAAVAQGQTFSVSAGDTGADECGNGGKTPSWPASSQYVVAVGGTELYVNPLTTWSSEIVWYNENQGDGATGGSPSTFEPMPSWQVGVGQNAGQTTRGVPDVAFDASPLSGALLIYNGQSGVQVGGTSLASPLFVGSWARMLAANGTGLGFAAPLIYKLPSTDFHDITSGDNGGEMAAAGWDYATGFGSLIMNQEVNDLGSAPVANFSYSVSGLTITFTDSSTYSGGTLSSHSWNFGDGGTSTATNPSHTYAASGTYSVTETVTANGASGSYTALVTTQSAPTAAPTLSVPPTSPGSYTVSWYQYPSVSGATYYNLQQQTTGGLWTTLLSSATTAWTTPVVESNGTYLYRVQACNVVGCGPWSTTGTVVVTNAPFIPPVFSSSTGNYTVNWTSVSGSTSYNLQQQNTYGVWTTVQSSAATSWVASGENKGIYLYRVQACNSSGCGFWSNTVPVVVSAPPPILTAPATSMPGVSYTVSWTSVSGAISYTLDQKSSSNPDWTPVQESAATSWVASGETDGTYVYQVQACYATYCTVWSATATTDVTNVISNTEKH